MFLLTIANQLKLLLNTPTGNDIWIYWDYANKMKSGLFPYVGFHPEYPPLSFFFIYVPYLINKDPVFYQFLYGLEVLVAICIGSYFIWALAKDFSKVWLWLLLLMIMQASKYHLVFGRFDIFVAVFTLIAFYFFKKKKEDIGWFFLFLATMTKIYPLVLLPALLYKARYKVLVLWFAIPLVITNTLLLLVTHGQYNDFLLKQLQRPVELESIESSFLLGLHLLNNFHLSPVYELNSWGLSVPTVTHHLLQVIIFMLLCIPIAVARKRLLSYSPIRLVVISILFFMLLNSVLSPQYFIWLIPFIPFLAVPEIILSIIICAITAWFFTFWDNGVSQLNNWILFLIVIRNILIFTFYYLIVLKPKWMKRTLKTF